ncbi:general substrate transporter [Thozetella sp. PMI_491]|nr:general substrate transporter [Thozetella sp. PMI_491]
MMVTGCSFTVHIITFVTFDKIGRRQNLLFGSLGMAATMLGTGAATAAGTASSYSAAYSIYVFTWAPGCWIVTAELGTGQLRERTLVLASMGSFVTSVPINFVNLYVQKAIGGFVTFIYGSFSILAIIWALFFIPETTKRSLEELADMF